MTTSKELMASSASASDSYSYPSYADLLIQRQQLFQHHDMFSQLNTRNQHELIQTDNTEDTLKLHGVNEDDIIKIHETNQNVKRGREWIMELLNEHKECNTSIYELEQKMKALNENIHMQKLCITTLAGLHERFADFKNQLKEYEDLKTSVAEDMEAELASHVLNKERIEALLASLGSTYNILRLTPLVRVCPICLTNEVDTYLDPCGHTLCKTCNRDKFCHMCRTQVRSSRKIYYS